MTHDLLRNLIIELRRASGKSGVTRLRDNYFLCCISCATAEGSTVVLIRDLQMPSRGRASDCPMYVDIGSKSKESTHTPAEESERRQIASVKKNGTTLLARRRPACRHD